MHKRKFRYKGMAVDIFGLPLLDDRPRIRKEKCLPKTVPKRQYLRSFDSSLKENAPKNLLLIYDIPEAQKKQRDWFRRQLRNLDFVMIQRSVWIGPSPLPTDFLSYVKRIGLKQEFKTFKLARAYSN